MTPANLITEGNLITAYTSSAAGSWSTNAGTLWLDPAATAIPYTGQAVTTVYLKAANKTMGGTISRGTDSGTVSITGVYPSIPNYPYEWQPDIKGVVVNVKRDGSISGRLLSDHSLKSDYKLVMNNNVIPEYEEFEVFWKYHYPNLRFKYSDKLRNLSLTAQFNSRPKVTARGPNRISYEVDLIQV